MSARPITKDEAIAVHSAAITRFGDDLLRYLNILL